MTRADHYQAGMELARQAMHASADGDDERALSILNSADQNDVTWACAYLLAALRETIAGRLNGNAARLREVMHDVAEPTWQDIGATRAALLVAAMSGGGSNG